MPQILSEILSTATYVCVVAVSNTLALLEYTDTGDTKAGRRVSTHLLGWRIDRCSDSLTEECGACSGLTVKTSLDWTGMP